MAALNHHANECFALLDDANASPAQPCSRLYRGYIGQLNCLDASHLPAMLDQMQHALQRGQHAIGLFDYELGAQLHGIEPHAPNSTPTHILLFEQCQMLSSEQVRIWLDEQAALPAPGQAHALRAGIAQVCNSLTETEFFAAIARIRAYIEAGDAYQINYTYRVRFEAFGSLFALYRRLRARQPVPYGALIALPDGSALLSMSPELFIQHRAGIVTARPMKGTAPVTDDVKTGMAALQADPKNRAENLMIVDLLRNDLGKVAQTGSVQVTGLFDVQHYQSVLQMTSTVQARVRADVSLTELLTALFPCGSITGAPKRRAMQIIRALEPQPRGFYTGAIGWFDAPPPGRALGDFCLSVPIRTLTLGPVGDAGVRSGEMGVGAGIVYDSQASDEYAECRLKAHFLTGLAHDFELFETLYATPQAGCRHAELHLQRLQSSARYFGFAYDEAQVRQVLVTAWAGLPTDDPEGAYRIRLTLTQNGVCKAQTAVLGPCPPVVRVLLAQHTTEASDLFLRHKSTVRAGYDTALGLARAQGAFDLLFCNSRGELTEGARSNVFVKLAGRWYTPPLCAGLLPGIMRAQLLADPAWNAVERRLTLADLRAAQEVVVCNALRGALPAMVEWPEV